jgi:hypothetical protein
MEDHETNILFEHTKRLREGRLNVEQQEERASFETKARRKFAKQVTPTHVGLVVKRNRRKGRRLSESSGASGAMSEPRTPWFKERWSVQPGKVETSQAHGVNHHSSQPTTVVTEMYGESIAPINTENVQTFSRHRVRSWRQNFNIATSKPTLKRVVHATYGNLLEGKNYKDSNTPGFVAVPQACRLQGNALYHML